MRRGQASVELLVVLSVIVVIMVVMGFFLYQKYVRGSELKIFVHGIRIVNMIADNVNEINAVGSGYSQHFTLPESLYGNREYTVSFFQNESTVYLKGGSFLRGIELYWSAPVSTTKVNCLMSECNTGCNKTANEVCLRVNGTMYIRVTNENEVVYLTYPYNLKQNQTKYYITPIRGNLTYTNESCARGSFIYVYKNLEDGTTNLVFQHNASLDTRIQMYFYDVMGDLNVTISDDPDELNLNPPSPMGNWHSFSNECDGGVINLKEGIHLCIRPDFSGSTMDWTWLNGDGTTIALDKKINLCLSYP